MDANTASSARRTHLQDAPGAHSPIVTVWQAYLAGKNGAFHFGSREQFDGHDYAGPVSRWIDDGHGSILGMRWEVEAEHRGQLAVLETLRAFAQKIEHALRTAAPSGYLPRGESNSLDEAYSEVADAIDDALTAAAIRRQLGWDR